MAPKPILIIKAHITQNDIMPLHPHPSPGAKVPVFSFWCVHVRFAASSDMGHSQTAALEDCHESAARHYMHLQSAPAA